MPPESLAEKYPHWFKWTVTLKEGRCPAGLMPGCEYYATGGAITYTVHDEVWRQYNVDYTAIETCRRTPDEERVQAMRWDRKHDVRLKGMPL